MAEIERLNKALKVAFRQLHIYKKSDMADYLGYKNAYFSTVINGKEKINNVFLEKISDKLNINSEYIKTGNGSMFNSENPINYHSFENPDKNVNIAELNELEELKIIIKKQEQDIELYHQLAMSRLQTIELQQEIIINLKKQIEKLNK